MKPGTTVIKKRTNRAFPPVVIVGSDDKRVWVDFGTIKILLTGWGDGSIIVVRGEARDEQRNPVPLAMRGATDVRNTIEYGLVFPEAPAAPD